MSDIEGFADIRRYKAVQDAIDGARADERAKVFREIDHSGVRLPTTECEELHELLDALGVDDNDNDEGLLHSYTLAERIQLLDDTWRDDLKYAGEAYDQLEDRYVVVLEKLARTGAELTEQRKYANETIAKVRENRWEG